MKKKLILTCSYVEALRNLISPYLVSFSLILNELKTNFANASVILGHSFVMIKRNFCSLLKLVWKCILFSQQSWNKTTRSWSYNGHIIIKWNSSSTSFLHLKHFLSFLSIRGLVYLPVSINKVWFERRKRVNFQFSISILFL